jgi:AcrR family transcriptional regulator
MKAKAAYHSPLREEQAAATRARILEGCVAITEKGGDLTYAAVAAAAGVQERTVYRHFPARADLQAGLWSWILEHLTHVDFSASTPDELVSHMRRSFTGFDAGAPLIQAMLHSPQGLEVRLRQQAQRRAMFESTVAGAVPEAPPDARLAAAAALQVLYSAPSWELLRSFWGMDAPEAANVIELAIRSMVAGLQLRFGGAISDRAPPSTADTPAATPRIKHQSAAHQSTNARRKSSRRQL